MKVLIKKGLVIDPKNNIKENLDILIENKYISKIQKNINVEADYVIDAKGLIVSPGFVDLHPNFCDPGVTSREDLKTGSLAAAKGGYTHVVLGVDNKPAPSECNVIEYIKKYSVIMPVNIYPSAAITVDRNGETISDFSFLYNHGAISFYDGLRPIVDKSLLEKIMIKISSIGKVLSLYNEDETNIKCRGIIDGSISKKLGIKGATTIDAEYNDLKINLEMAEVLKCKLDVAYVSSKESVELIKEAKDKKQDVYAEVPVLNLLLTDKAIEKYGSLAKVLPPLRSEADRKALCQGLKKGIIDIISSNHLPILEDDKKLKLKDALCGSIGLETTLGVIGKALVDDGYLDWKKVIEKISYNPAKLFGLDKDGAGYLEEGNISNITIFDPEKTWKLAEENIISKSHNTPLIGIELKGEVIYTICNGKLVYKNNKVEE